MGEELNRLLFIYNLGYLKPEHNFHWSRRSRETQLRSAAERRSREVQPRDAAERWPEISLVDPARGWRRPGHVRELSGTCPGHVRVGRCRTR